MTAPRALLPRAPLHFVFNGAAGNQDDAAVLAVGGDGTINTVASVVLGGRGVLGLVPRGTFNCVARTHGIPLEPAAALRPMKVSTLFVGNNALQLQALGLPEAELAGRSALAALALRAFKPGELLWLALRGALGRLGEAPDLTHFACQTLTVRPLLPLQRRLKVALDGEVLRLPPPLVFAVDARPLWLIKPDAEARPAVAASAQAEGAAT